MSIKELGLIFLFLAAWIVLNRWVLPWFGISTCMSGGCTSGSCTMDRAPRMKQQEDDPTDLEASPSQGTCCEGAPLLSDEPVAAEEAAKQQGDRP